MGAIKHTKTSNFFLNFICIKLQYLYYIDNICLSMLINVLINYFFIKTKILLKKKVIKQHILKFRKIILRHYNLNVDEDFVPTDIFKIPENIYAHSVSRFAKLKKMLIYIDEEDIDHFWIDDVSFVEEKKNDELERWPIDENKFECIWFGGKITEHTKIGIKSIYATEIRRGIEEGYYVDNCLSDFYYVIDPENERDMFTIFLNKGTLDSESFTWLQDKRKEIAKNHYIKQYIYSKKIKIIAQKIKEAKNDYLEKFKDSIDVGSLELSDYWDCDKMIPQDFNIKTPYTVLENEYLTYRWRFDEELIKRDGRELIKYVEDGMEKIIQKVADITIGNLVLQNAVVIKCIDNNSIKTEYIFNNLRITCYVENNIRKTDYEINGMVYTLYEHNGVEIFELKKLLIMREIEKKELFIKLKKFEGYLEKKNTSFVPAEFDTYEPYRDSQYRTKFNINLNTEYENDSSLKKVPKHSDDCIEKPKIEIPAKPHISEEMRLKKIKNKNNRIKREYYKLDFKNAEEEWVIEGGGLRAWSNVKMWIKKVELQNKRVESLDNAVSLAAEIVQLKIEAEEMIRIKGPGTLSEYLALLKKKGWHFKAKHRWIRSEHIIGRNVIRKIGKRVVYSPDDPRSKVIYLETQTGELKKSFFTHSPFRKRKIKIPPVSRHFFDIYDFGSRIWEIKYWKYKNHMLYMIFNKN